MRALVCTRFGGEELLELRDDWSAGPCGPNQVRVEVHAASVNFPDVLRIRDLYQHKVPLPFVPGSEVGGRIAEVGSSVTGVAVGARVLAMAGVGGFAEELVVHASPGSLMVVPETMDMGEAAGFNVTYGTAGHALLRRARVEPGETVLVLGAAGGCGTAAIQVAKAMGATVIAVAGGPEKAAVCRQLGADEVIDHRSTESLSTVVKELTGGRGVDVLFDPVGGADVRDYLRCVAWDGRYLVVGFASGDIPKVGLNQTILKSISIVGVAYGESARKDPASNAELFEQLFAWHAEGLVKPLVTQRFPLEQGAEAMRTVGERRALGKVVVDVRPR